MAERTPADEKGARMLRGFATVNYWADDLEAAKECDHDLIHKATGGWLREAGKKDRRRLLSFLDEHAATMPRTMLRYAIEHLDKERRTYYLSTKNAG